MYLLSVLSSDRTAEITFLLSLNSSYSTLISSLPSKAVSNIHQIALQHHTRRFYNPTYAGLITSLTAESPDSPPQALRPHLHSQTHHSSSSSSNNNKDPSSQQVQQQQQQSQTLRSQYGRFLPPPPTSPPSRHAYLSTLEEVLGKYWNEEKDAGREVDDGEERNWVYLATPFVCCYARPVAVFLAFQKLMERMSQSESLRHGVSVANVHAQGHSRRYHLDWRRSSRSFGSPSPSCSGTLKMSRSDMLKWPPAGSPPSYRKKCGSVTSCVSGVGRYISRNPP